MPQLVTIRPLTSYVNTPSVRIFQQYAGESMGFSDHCKKCLEALHGFPASQVNALMVGILAVAFEV